MKMAWIQGVASEEQCWPLWDLGNDKLFWVWQGSVSFVVAILFLPDFIALEHLKEQRASTFLKIPDLSFNTWGMLGKLFKSIWTHSVNSMH